MSKSKELVTTYLAKLGDTPLLTQEEEIEIAKALEKNDSELIKVCVHSPIFLKELLEKRDRMVENPNLIQRYSKKISEDSTIPELEEFISYFIDMCAAIEEYLECGSKAKIKIIKDSLKHISLTNSAITKLIKPIKDLYKEILDYEKKTIKNYNFFYLITDEK